MFGLLLIIISYGALLLLLLPPTITGLIAAVVLFSLGTGLIVYKKVYKIPFWKSRQILLIPVAFFIATQIQSIFHHLWLYSSKMQAVAALAHMPVEKLVSIGLSILSVLSAYIIYAALQGIIKLLSYTKQENDFVRSLIFCPVAAIITVMQSQTMIGMEAFSMGYPKFWWSVLIVGAVILLLYCLFRRIIPAILVGAGIFMLISTVNVYIYKFRGRLFEPVDVLSAGTAMNVAENYNLLPIPETVLISWGIFATMLIVFYYLQHKNKTGLTTRRRLVLLAICTVSAVAISFYAYRVQTYHWGNDGARYNGFILNFVSKFKEISASRPDHYSKERIAQLADQYGSDENANEPSEHPHIIVVMDEAFSDLEVVGEFSTNREVIPFISSLKENTISGYALASVYGGNTANTEYEFLTGNSMAWLSSNVVPYQQYIRSSTYSMVSYLKSSYDYKCVAMHPFQSSGWNRPAAYKYLGFDESYFVEDFPREDYVRGYISDREMFDFLIETYEAQKEDPLFIFGVTMQNHGDYDYTGGNYTKHISLNDYGSEFEKIEQYLSLIHETDKAVEHLITYFENVDEDVVIVFFGDHQPKIDASFYEAISGTTADTLDEQQKRYEVPFFIWTNYDIEEESIPCTSINYLSSYVYDAAGIALPPYNRFLREMEENIPSINANGFYSPTAGCYLPLDAANGEEQRWLELYEALQYNSAFDKKNRNEILFPVLE